MPKFVPALELNRRFYSDVVGPLLASEFPSLKYIAALIGPGSEVIGFDTEMSMDHDWGLHFFVLISDEDDQMSQQIANVLSYKLPETYGGFPVSISPVSPKPSIREVSEPLPGPVKHHITPITLRKFCVRHFGFDVLQTPLHLDPIGWLTIPSHILGEAVKGQVYHDGLATLTQLREELTWYPHDVWLYLLASGWARIGEEEHLMSRAGYAGSELGSSLIASRLVRDVMNLAFLMERKYAPYPKWFGQGFHELQCAEALEPLLMQVQRAETWDKRHIVLAKAYEILADMHNKLGIGGREMPITASMFWDRPFQVIHGEVFAEALKSQIRDPAVKKLAEKRLIGGISQWTDNCAMGAVEHGRVRGLYE